MEKQVVLSVKDLRINFSTDHGYVQAVRGVSFDLYKGETLCIVGESGSGKSVTSKAIMGILSANGRIMNGSIMYEGEDLTKVSEDEFHRIRGHKIGMIFQDPLSSLNPIVKIGKQITEAMLINSSRIKKMYSDKVADALVAYKNAVTEYKLAVNSSKEKVKFLKGERKKDINKAKANPSLIYDGKRYSMDLEYNGKCDEHKEIIKNLNTQKAEELKNASDIDTVNSKYDALIKAELDVLENLKEEYLASKQAVKEEKLSNKKEVKTALEEIKTRYEHLIEEAVNSGAESKEQLDVKFKPVIKEKKAAYKVRSKEAKAEVKEYKKSLKTDYQAKCKAANGNKEELEKLKAEYISHLYITKAEAKNRALQIMKEVGISEPEKRYNQYPFEFSGGMRQRIVIAIALTANPDILICDEPTTALDVTIQAQILELINKLKKERDMTCIFITHDLGVVANMADRVAVMYAGKIVEYGTEREIFYEPKHPYTWALLSSIPDVDSKEKLEAIPGTPPNMIYPPVGDAFALRSKYAMSIDFKKEPPLFKVSDTHYAATWLLDPRAPKVEMPKIVKTRIENSLKSAKERGLK